MDFYEILGVQQNATQEEIKTAYRKEAMKWHPDRNNNSSESKLLFQGIAQAYKVLSDVDSRNEYDEGLNPEEADTYDHSSEQYYEEPGAHEEEPPSYEEPARESYSDDFADTIFWEAMLDFAIELARSGMQEKEIYINLSRKGCPEKLADAISRKAHSINENYSSTSKKKSGNQHGSQSSKTLSKQDFYRAFLGKKRFIHFRDPEKYYINEFKKFDSNNTSSLKSRFSVNGTLLFVTLLYAPIFTYFWFFVRKIYSWKLLVPAFITLIGLGFIGVLAAQNFSIAASVIIVSLFVCLFWAGPFILAFYGNYFYYLFTNSMIDKAHEKFEDDADKINWLKSKGGISSTASILLIAIYVITNGALIVQIFNTDTSYTPTSADTTTVKKSSPQANSSVQLYDDALKHYNASPPRYGKALKSFLLSAKKNHIRGTYAAGYMYYYGEGTDIDIQRAFQYFEKAIKIYNQKTHKKTDDDTLDIADAYNFLGIILSDGEGVPKDLTNARQMYALGSKHGSYWAKYNLGKMYSDGTGGNRDYKKAIELLNEAAIHDVSPAFVELALIYGDPVNFEEYNFKISFNFLKEAVGKSNGDAEYYLGYIYESDDLGKKKDIRTSIEWYEKSISQGSNLVSREYINDLKKQL
ncbi:DnaJ domain-containing protein [Gammaproteobacteria bacterium]|nr:DnaJ domain-containing protein [Gammaproteobacteria bacterium]